MSIPRYQTIGPRLFTILLIGYGLWLICDYQYHFIDGANLLIHETGHMIFLPLGQTLHIMGGTFWQLAVPLMVSWIFWLRRKPWEAAVCSVWLGESLMYTSVYVRDAMALQLPRVGGPIHDWNWMLSRMGMLRYCEDLAAAIYLSASVLIALSLFYMALLCFPQLTALLNPGHIHATAVKKTIH